MRNSLLTNRRRYRLLEAAADFYLLQNRGYPRAASLEWVGTRYGLCHEDRQLLLRGVFSQADALRRRSRRSRGSDWRRKRLFVDGHNVQITVESALLERPLVVGNDGALRDIAGQSARFRMSEVSETALDWIFRFLKRFPPVHTVFLFDAPMSHSGLLAARCRERLEKNGLPGEARAVPVPEREIPRTGCVVAGSDHAVLDDSESWLDLARSAIDAAEAAQPVVDFSALIMFRPGDRWIPCDPPF